MMIVAATSISSSFSGPNRRIQWRRNEKRRLSTEVAVSGVITAGFELKPPPYPLDALEPHMSRETLDYHWGKHHRTYVENLNKQIAGTDLDALSLEEVVLLSYNRGNMLPAFNNAAQREILGLSRNFWKDTSRLQFLILVRVGHGLHASDFNFVPFPIVEKYVNLQLTYLSFWGSIDADKANRLDVANAVNPLPKEEDKKLVIVKTPNAVNPLIWDYSNRRDEYINTFMEKLVSWETVSTRLEAAMVRATQREQEGTDTEDEENPDHEEPEVYLDSDIDVSEVD
uniref:superoxide dismutase n=1 Tax=Boechera stricta TaxID=72658 RepID=K4FQD8_BOEST|nr:hypothetical protein 7G9.19 [Boechera stricta]